MTFTCIDAPVIHFLLGNLGGYGGGIFLGGRGAECVNGILKTEVIYREKRFKTYQDALERISGFIAFYNETRPHSNIGMKTPSEAHKEQGPQRIMRKPASTLSGAVCPLPLGTP